MKSSATLELVVLLLIACTPARLESFRMRTMPGDDITLGQLLYQGIGATLKPGHTVEFVENGAVFQAMVDDIAEAKTSITMVTYIWEKGAASDRLIAALVPRARQKIPCRILVDWFGSPDWQGTLRPLVTAGCEVRGFRPLPGVDALARNHRKMLIIDGTRAITGGFGVRDNWLGDGLSPEHWRDSNMRIAGPAVREMQQAFAANWLEAGGAPMPEAEAFPSIEPVGRVVAAYVPSVGTAVGTAADRLTQLTILTAKKRVWIANAYFVPTGAIYDLLRDRARAGIDVRLLTAGAKSDSKTAFAIQQAQYGALREAGVKIWEYQPAMMHSKTMLIDDDLVLLGSVNLDPLSLGKLDEGEVVVEDRAFAAQLERIFENDVKHSAAKL